MQKRVFCRGIRKYGIRNTKRIRRCNERILKKDRSFEMSEELKKLWEEIKEYVITNKETYELELVKDAPKEIQEKFKKYVSMMDDEIIIPSKKDNA